MGRRSRDDRSGRPMGPLPAIAALRAWRQAERKRRTERELREKVRARRQIAAEKRRTRVEAEAALYETHLERALVHARDQLDRDEARLHERISEISARRLVTPGSVGALLLAVGLLVAPYYVVAWFQHHKVRPEYGLMIAMGGQDIERAQIYAKRLCAHLWVDSMRRRLQHSKGIHRTVVASPLVAEPAYRGRLREGAKSYAKPRTRFP